MTTTTTIAARVPIEPAFSDAERLVSAGYRGLAREAYALDLHQFTPAQIRRASRGNLLPAWSAE